MGEICSKTGYGNGALAREALEGIQAMAGGRNGLGGSMTKPTRFYRCTIEGCGQFHLTSTPIEVERRNKRGDNTRKPKFPQPAIDPDDDIFKPLHDMRLDYDI
jgi:hypothetical protein